MQYFIISKDIKRVDTADRIHAGSRMPVVKFNL